MVRMARVGGSMQVGDLVIEGLSQYIGIITAVYPRASTYFVQFFDTYDGEDLSDWYIAEYLEVI